MNTLPADGDLLELVVQQSPLTSPELWNELHLAYDENVVPLFSVVAKRALELVDPNRDAEVIDVACGPGTLTLQLATQVRRVVAVDFAPSMIELLEDKCRVARIGNIAAQVADGMALPFGQGRFDAAFSCFGLFLFADRAAGFSELWRVVKPGAKVMVSSWSPAEGPIEAMYRIVREVLPDLPFQKGRAPLGTKGELVEEMTQARFESIYVESIPVPFVFDSAEHFWRESSRASAPLVATRRHVTDTDWPAVESRIKDTLREAFPGRVDFVRNAWIALGTRPKA